MVVLEDAFLDVGVLERGPIIVWRQRSLLCLGGCEWCGVEGT
jgi:hypothetical protein